MTAAVLAPLVAAVRAHLDTGAPRALVGLAGPPGTGKSTAAAALVEHLRAAGTSAVLVPMDGFHLDQLELERLARAERKGAPDTFDAAGYAALLRRLAEQPRSGERVVYAPRFDRHLEQAVAGAVPVAAAVQVVVTEGNYLLHDGEDAGGASWSLVRPCLDTCWFVETPDDLRVDRLVARHVAHGRSPQAAREWVLRNDEANARLVARGRDRADGVLVWS
jgi:pantothenate kinase